MKVYAMIPTYNEKDTIEKLITALLRIPRLHPLVVDDNSPDGTAAIVRRMRRANRRVELIVRTRNRGRGNAGKAGFEACIRRGADAIVEMDADFSHDPKYIPALVRALSHCDLVLGSRQVRGGKQVGRPLRRRILTYFANLYIRLVLGVRVGDCNSGFRAFRRDALRKILNAGVHAPGPDIVQEVLYRAHLLGLRICEIPITFAERTEGSSKLGLKQLWRGYTAVLNLRARHLFGKF